MYSVTKGLPPMRELVRTLVAEELLGGLGAGHMHPEHEELHSKASLQVLRLLGVAPRPRCGAGPGEEEAIIDRIASHLLRSKRPDSRGVDRHLRFSGLSKRICGHPGLRDTSARRSVLSLLYQLRGGAERDGGGSLPRGAGGPIDLASFGLGVEVGALAVPSRPTRVEPLADAGVAFVPRLGWRSGGGGSWSPISEQQLLRDLLYALQGVDSNCFRLRRAEGRFDVNPSYSLSRPVWLLSQRILELASLRARLCALTDAVLDGDAQQSLLHQALGEALRHQLRDYYKVLALLMSKLESAPLAGDVPKLTLRRLWAWLQAPLERMRLLLALAEACAPLRGGALASMVHGFSRTGDAPARDACLAILRRVVEPLLSMIRAWMTEGELSDPFGEFFVCADVSAPLAELWNGTYTLDVEMVPSFITLELARKILLTGKSVNFMRLCCPGHDWLSGGRDAGDIGAWESDGCGTGVSAIALPWDKRDVADIGEVVAEAAGAPPEPPLVELAARVESAARLTNRHLVSLLMKQYALSEHCLALRRFLLLGQGDFVESLMGNIVSDLNREANEVYRHQLIGFLDMAVRQSNAQFCSADVLARLGVKLLAPSPGERGWDIFLLDYAVDSPLDVVFSPAAMQQYHRAFAFLWKLRRVSHALASCWGDQMALQRHLISRGQELGAHAPDLSLEVRQTLHKCTCLRNEMHHFAQNISSYIMCEVLDTAWAKLQAGWQECEDLDQVIREHGRYLLCIEEGAFLAAKTEPVLTALTTLFGLALEFTELHEQVCTSAFEAIEVLGSEPELGDQGPLPFARSFAECRVQLDQVGAAFLMRLQALLRALETQPPLQHLTSDLRFLLCRLDFNGHYEQRRTAPFAERIRVG